MSSDRDRFVAFAFCWADLLVELDQSRKVLFAVGATKSYLGFGAEKLLGRNFMDVVSPKDRVLLDQLLEVTARKGRIDGLSVRLVGDKGPTAPLNVTGYMLPDLKDHYFIAMRLSVRVDAAGQLDGKPRDAATGLMSGDSFTEMAAKKLKDTAGTAKPVEMTLVSLPDFQSLADSLPADEKQILLNTVSTTLRASSVDGDAAGAIGDGKYGVLHEKGLDVKALENKIAEATRAFDPAGKGIDVQAGTLDIDTGAITEEDLTKGLVYTINHFKDQAGAKFNVKDIASNMNNLVKEAVNSLKTFRALVGTADFQVAFHPILDVRTGAVHHYEALVRFGGNYEQSPYKYITFAEETGLINEFDIAMARKCVEWLRKHKGDKVSLAVNISGMSVDNAQYTKELHALLDADTWLRHFLVFEITESARVADLKKANVFVQSLRTRGFHVCLDDFGAGAASFQYLSVLEVDVVKLDGSAVKNAQAAPKGRAFLKALTTLCKTMEVETIAEMVDSKETLEFVRDCGVEYVQGFLFGKPDADPWQFIKKLDRRLFADTKR